MGEGSDEEGGPPRAATAASSSSSGPGMTPQPSIGDEDEDVPFFEETVHFPPDVEAALAEVFPSTDALDSPDFDPVQYINTMFPNEQSLSGLDGFTVKIRAKIRNVDRDLQAAIRTQTAVGQNGQHALEDASMSELFSRIRDIRAKAELSEKIVQEITRDIKSLDYAKKHLTNSITTLNHLHMLVGGIDSLHTMAQKRQYRDASHLLGALINVMEHFERYMEIPRIKDLAEKIAAIKRQLGTQIVNEFHDAFRGPVPDRVDHDVNKLTEGCHVLDVLDKSIKEDLIRWFVNLQLRDYRDLFNPTKDASWIDKIDRRYAWLKRTLMTYNENCRDIFPPTWHMREELSLRFCEMTREDLHQILQERRDQLDVKLLVFAIERTLVIERWLSSQFKQLQMATGSMVDDEAGVPAEGESESEEEEDDIPEPVTEADRIRAKYLQHRREKQRQERQARKPKAARAAASSTAGATSGISPSKFVNAISKVFEDYMEVYVDAQDQSLDSMIEQCATNFRSDLPDSDDHDSKLLESGGQLFLFFKNCMVQCTQLGADKALFNLFLVFRKHLQNYGQKILVANLPKGSALAALLMKDGDIKLSPEEVFVVCVVLNTAEYCLDTTKQLEEKLKEKVDEEQRESVDLNAEVDMFHEVISNCVQLLTRCLETNCEAALIAMTKMKWDNIEEVGDCSPYVTQMSKHISQLVPSIRSNLSNSRKYFTNFCLKFVNSFIPRVISHMYKCKNVSTVGAEQLLLDMQSVRTLLLEMPSIGSAVARKAPASYTRFVTKGMSKAEMILKVLMGSHTPANLYVEDYIKLVGDEEGISAFQRILDMKGLGKKEQQPLLEAFRALSTSTAGDEASAAPATPSRRERKSAAAALSGLASPKRSSIRKLERLIKRFQ